MGEQSKGVKEQAEGGVFLQEGVRGGKRVGEGGVRMGEWVTGVRGAGGSMGGKVKSGRAGARSWERGWW